MNEYNYRGSIRIASEAFVNFIKEIDELKLKRIIFFHTKKNPLKSQDIVRQIKHNM